MKLSTAFTPAILGGIVAWFAQITGSGVDPGVLSLVGNGITVIVLAWYVVYDVRVRTPNMFSIFTREQDELRAAFKEEQAGSRETFTKTIDLIRTTFQNEQSVVRQENREDRGIIRANHSEQIEHWRKMVSDMLVGMRGAVNETRDLAQTVITAVEKADREKNK